MSVESLEQSGRKFKELVPAISLILHRIDLHFLTDMRANKDELSFVLVAQISKKKANEETQEANCKGEY